MFVTDAVVNVWTGIKAGGNDPLLFVESIPVAETRSYVKRLMAYHWLYRRRFGQDANTAAAKPYDDLDSRQEHGRGNGVQGSRTLLMLRV